MRLFVAIDLASGVRASIAREQERLARLLAERQPRWVRPEQIHLTLAFIGEAADERVPAIVETMSHDISLPPFQVVLGGFGMFPTHGAPRVLWMGVVEGAEAVVDLQHEVVRRLNHAGVVSEERVFRPHLTLGRWRLGRPSDRSRVSTEAVRVIEAGTVEAITLYESRMSSSGAIHQALTRARLHPG